MQILIQSKRKIILKRKKIMIKLLNEKNIFIKKNKINAPK
jgi:DUF1009 family protein